MDTCISQNINLTEEIMANIKPFRGYRYNPEKISNIGSVVSPPYYNINEKDKARLYDISDYNSIRLYSGENLETDTETDNKFTRAKKYLYDWIEQDIIVRDKEPAIYMYEQIVEVYGVQYSNRNFITLLELEEYNKDSIMPCESAKETSMSDRYNFLAATNADMSMISCLYVENEKELLKLMNELSEEKPDMEFDSYDENQHLYHRVWVITYKPTIDYIVERFKDKPLYITDGQARYEVCLKYRNYMKANNPDHNGTEPYNYTMVSLANSNSDGIVILPFHRMVHHPRFREEFFVACIQDHFKIEKIIIDSTDDSMPDTMRRQIATTKNETRIAAYIGGDYFYRLTLTDKDYIKQNLLPEMSKAYCGLDVVVLNKLILEEIFHMDEEKQKENVVTNRSYFTCCNSVERGDSEIAFIMNSVKTEQIKNVTAAGERMPDSTVCIYPKPSVGVVINIKED